MEREVTMNPTNQGQMHPINQRHSKENIACSEYLRHVLSETFVLYMKTYAVHWNYEGPKFFSVHKLTEEHYKNMADSIDDMAERIRALGESAPVSLVSILKDSDLAEIKHNPASDQALQELVRGHEILANSCVEAAKECEQLNDLFSHDLLVLRQGFHQKAAWMLRSFQH